MTRILVEPAALRVEGAPGRAALLRLNRPEALNAIDTQLAAELREAFLRLSYEEDVRVLILSAVPGKAFCAGADLKERSGFDSEAWFRHHAVIRSMFQAVAQCPKPVIAAVEGMALGGGFELVLNCDMVVASEEAVFALPEVSRGIIPGGGGTQLLPRLIGLNRARELILTGRRLPAAEAERWGIVNRLVPAGKAEEAALELAGEILAQAPIAVEQALVAMEAGYNLDLPAALRLETAVYNRCVPTRDREEGVRAFAEKRAPRFEGR